MARIIRKRNRAKFYAEIWTLDERGQRQRVEVSTGILDDGSKQARRAAEAIARELELRRAAGTAAPKGASKTLGEALRALTEAQVLAQRAPGTLAGISARGLKLVEAFGLHRRMADIGAEELVEYATQARATRAAATVKLELGTLAAAFQALALVPPKKPSLGRIKHKPQRVLELDEQRALLMAIRPARRLNVMAYLRMGLRKSEPWKVVGADWKARFLLVQGTKRVIDADGPRTVPMADDIFELLSARKNEPTLFPMWSSMNIHNSIRAAGQRAGISEDLSANDLRGTFATTMARAGVDLATLASIMGNSISELEATYAQLRIAGDHHRTAIDKLPTLFPSAAPSTKQSKKL